MSITVVGIAISEKRVVNAPHMDVACKHQVEIVKLYQKKKKKDAIFKLSIWVHHKKMYSNEYKQA